jgi:predicted enzyme related to lactoylglutathione lyase
MVTITDIAFTSYPVTDIARARAFYEGVLNLKLTVDFGQEGQHWIEYDVGPSTIAITNMFPEWKPSSEGPSIAFEVADFDAAVAAARTGKVVFAQEPLTTPGCRLAILRDPDGNSLALHKRNS